MQTTTSSTSTRLERRRLDAEAARDSSEEDGEGGKRWNRSQQLRVVERRERRLQKGFGSIQRLLLCCVCVCVCVAAQSMTSGMQALKPSCAYLQAPWACCGQSRRMTLGCGASWHMKPWC